jgi:5-methylcytosine-specific restriction protein A
MAAWRPGDRIPSRPSRPAWARALEVKPRRATDQRALDAFIDSKAWRTLRKAYITTNPLCELCKDDGRYVAASHVHHKISRAERPDLALDWDGLQSLCKPCHSRLTIAERARRPRDR